MWEEATDQITLMIAKPHTASAVHHHGKEGESRAESLQQMQWIVNARHLDTIVYAVKGYGTIVSGGGTVRHDLCPGDFALIPAFAEHQEVNDSDEDVTWMIARGGRNPIVENLDGWTKNDTAGS